MERVEKQTAVEWLESYLNNRLLHLTNNKIHIKEFVRTAKCAEIRKVLEIIEQAKAMEKEQIIDAYDDGKSDGYKTAREWDEMVIFLNAEQYYNETFKSE